MDSLHIHGWLGVCIYNGWRSCPQTSAWNKIVKWWYSEISKWKYLEDKNPWKFALVGFEGSVGLGLLEYDPEELATTVKGIYVWGKGIDHFW